MFRAVLAALLLCGGLFSTAARADTVSPIGSWLTADGQAVVTFQPCGADICGHIAGMTFMDFHDVQPRDWRGQPQCGDVIVAAAAVPGAPDKWRGTVTDPRNGHVWRATLTLRGGNLYLRGYVGLPLFGETQAWTPYTGQIRTGCRLMVE